MILLACAEQQRADNWAKKLKDFQVFGQHAHDKRELHTLMRKNQFKVLVLDIVLLGQEGIDGIAAVHELCPDTCIIIMTPTFKPREELFAVLFGAKAYIEYDIAEALMHKVVSKVSEGEVWVDRQFVGRLVSELEAIAKEHHHEVAQIEKGIMTMTPRENEIAELIATGASNRCIAEKLSISERTVKAHLGVIFKKIGINDRLQLALYMNKYHQLSNLWHSRDPSS